MGTEGPFPGAKAQPERDADHSPPSSARSRMSRSYISSSPKRLPGVLWDSFSFSHALILLSLWSFSRIRALQSIYITDPQKKEIDM
jgi:hypothetical protein